MTAVPLPLLPAGHAGPARAPGPGRHAPGGGGVVPAPLPRRAHGAPGGGLAADRRRARRPRRRPHRFGQDPRRLPRVHRPALPRPRARRGDRRRGAGRLRVAAEGAGRRHRREPRATAGRDRRGRRRARPRARPTVRVGVRTGDTTSSQRTSMVRKPPSFVVTTPESLYLLVTSEKGRDALRTVETVIVDEIHAVARDKRGAHLAITLERLEALCEQRPGAGRTVGHATPDRDRRAAAGRRPSAPGRSSTPGTSAPSTSRSSSPTASWRRSRRPSRWATCSTASPRWSSEHRTTLVFVNTRRLAERLAHQLGERLGDDVVAAHHGSLSKERRHRVETRLRAGDLRALVATASLELGIDIGPVELVCQIGSPRSIATFLQRVGRSNHTRAGTPKGRLYPLTRDELVECTALLAAVHAGRLDAIQLPAAPARHRRPADRRRGGRAGVAHRRPVRARCAAPRRTTT